MEANLSSDSLIETMPFWYVYLLQCRNGTVYVGCTSNIAERLQRHRNGQVRSTCKLLPAELLCYTAFPDKYKAFAYERYLKSGSGRAFAKRHLR